MAGNLTVNNRLLIRRATGKIGGAYEPSGVASSHVNPSSLSPSGFRLAAAASVFVILKIQMVDGSQSRFDNSENHCLQWKHFSVMRSIMSEVAFGSVAMWLLKMQWPPLTTATRRGVVGRPSSCHDA